MCTLEDSGEPSSWGKTAVSGVKYAMYWQLVPAGIVLGQVSALPTWLKFRVCRSGCQITSVISARLVGFEPPSCFRKYSGWLLVWRLSGAGNPGLPRGRQVLKATGAPGKWGREANKKQSQLQEQGTDSAADSMYLPQPLIQVYTTRKIEQANLN